MIANPNITSTQQVKPADGETLLWACDQRDPRTLGPGLLNDARNLRFTDGVPTTRKGVTKPAWANYITIGNVAIGSLGVPYGSGVFRDPNGVEWQVIAAGGYVWRTRPHNGNVTIPLPPGITIVSPCRFVQAFDMLFLFRGRYLAPLVLSDLDTGFTDLLPRYDALTTYKAVIVATGQTADEMAYGPYLAVQSLTWANGVATCVTTLPHGYVTGTDVTIKGAVQSQFNSRFGITLVDDYTFTFSVKNVPVTTATGTITVSNNAYYWTALGSVANVTSLTQVSSTSFQLISLTSPATFAPALSCARSNVPISSLTRSGTTATAISPSHGLATGASVTIAGATHLYYNGTFTVTVLDANTFTFVMLVSPNGNETTTNAEWASSYTQLATAYAANHGLASGDVVTITGDTQTAYNVTNALVTVLNVNQFTYWMAGVPTGASGGTIVCTPPNNNIATAVKPGHGLTSGATVSITGATPSAYNGSHVVTVVNTSTFTYLFSGGVASPAAGVIMVSVTGGLTVTAVAPQHGFVTGDSVTITGAYPAAYNGTFFITVVDANTFTYVLATNPGTAGTGAVITAQTSRVLPGQNPDTNPEAWQQAYDVLPNADTGLFINNLLLVPTAYQPSSVDNYATINGGEYSKTDFVVATNYLDYIHFSFLNEFRINQGGSDEIVDLFKFGSSSTSGQVVVLKDKSWAILSGITSDLSGITLDVRSTEYGASGPRCWAVVGSNAYFLSPTYGVMVIRQTDLGIMLSVNVPLSAPIQKTIDAIDWTQASTFRMSHWDNKLYLAVTVKNVGRVILVYDFKASVHLGNNVWESGVMTQGWTPMDTGSALSVLEFHRLTLNGEDRHFFLDTNGYVNLMEESDYGDQVVGTGPQGLAWAEIYTYALSRAYGASVQGLPRPTETGLSLATFNPCYTIQVVFAGVNNVATLAQNVTRSNTTYDRPFSAQPWHTTNVNDDWGTPWREDYSVWLVTVTGPNLVSPGQYYTPQNGDLYHGVLPILGATYTYTPGPNDGQLQCGLTQSINGGTFVGLTSGFTIYGAAKPIGQQQDWPVTATVAQVQGLNLGSGFALDQFQEVLDTRRASRIGGKSYQLAISNTQGKIKLVGQRVDALPGMDVRGPMV